MILTAFITGIIFAVSAFLAVLIYNSIEFINSNRWPEKRNRKTKV